MTNVVYTAEAHVTGGRLHGRGTTTGGELDLAIRLPVELGGDGSGVNPEQLLALGWAACFEASLFVAAHQADVSLRLIGDAAIDARVALISQPGTPELELAAELDVSLPSVEDIQLAAELVRATHALCPYSKATSGNIEVTLIVNGTPVERLYDSQTS